MVNNNTLNVIRNISCPVMVIPAEAKYKELKKAVFISDFEDVVRTNPFVAIKTIPDTFKPKLHTINLKSNYFNELTPEFKIEKEYMKDKLGSLFIAIPA